MKGIVILAVYLGKLPDYFDLWIKSCACNPDINWVVLTDDHTKRDMNCAASNVMIAHTSPKDIMGRLNRYLGVHCQDFRPYKICDYKPAYALLFPEYVENYSFWGHTDLDLLYGCLSDYLSPEVLSLHDRVFTLGHLSVYRNTYSINTFFQNTAKEGVDWRFVYSSAESFGFDEHNWVNITWDRLRSQRQMSYLLEIADIVPHLSNFETKNTDNYFRQIFSWENGRVYQTGFRRGRTYRKEYAYIHLQKRRLQKVHLAPDEPFFLICPHGFIPMIGHVPTISEAIKHNSLHPLKELHCIRTRIKQIKTYGATR